MVEEVLLEGGSIKIILIVGLRLALIVGFILVLVEPVKELIGNVSHGPGRDHDSHREDHQEGKSLDSLDLGDSGAVSSLCLCG